MNIFKKIKLLRYYAKTIKANKKELLDTYNVKVDSIYRLYTIYGIDENEYNTYGGDDYINLNNNNTLEGLLQTASGSGKVMNGEDLFNKNMDADLSKLENFLIQIGLAEMYGMSQKQRIDKLNYKVVIEFKFISTKFLANLAVLLGLTVIGSVIIGGIIGLFMIFL